MSFQARLSVVVAAAHYIRVGPHEHPFHMHDIGDEVSIIEDGAGDEELTFMDQIVEVDDTGMAVVNDKEGMPRALVFRMDKPITPSDLEI
jgi:hypothetical protein